jgi:hypothetical protein
MAAKITNQTIPISAILKKLNIKSGIKNKRT